MTTESQTAGPHSGSTPILIDSLWAALSEIDDPELGVPITELGLVYRVDESDGRVLVDITTTTPICPLGSYLEQSIVRRLGSVAGVATVAVRVVHQPPWSPDRMTDKARSLLGWPAATEG